MMANIQAKKASESDVSELGSIISGLNSEFTSYPPEMQEQVRESKERLVAFISRLQSDLKAKLEAKQSKAVEATTAEEEEQEADEEKSRQCSASTVAAEHCTLVLLRRSLPLAVSALCSRLDVC